VLRGGGRYGADGDDGGLDDAVGGVGFGGFGGPELGGFKEAGEGDGAGAGPGLGVVGGALDPDGPGEVALNGGAGEDGAVGEKEGFVADGAVDAGGEVDDGGPGAAFVVGEAAGGGPPGVGGAELVVEPEAVVGVVEEDGVPGRGAGLAGEFDGFCPAGGGVAGGVDGYVGGAFGGASKPGSEDVSVVEFDEG